MSRSVLHAFSYREAERVVVDPVSGVTFRASERDFPLFEALACGLSGGDIARTIERVGCKSGDTVARDMESLSAAGLFSREALGLERQHAQAVETYLAHAPRKMMLLVSQTCNLRCVYCYAIEGNFHDEGRLMTLETAQQAIRFLAARSRSRNHLTVTLFGGEPLINFRMIRELVPWAREWLATVGKTIHFCITTNGTLLSDEIIDFLIAEKFSVMISLDGGKDAQDASRPTAAGGGSYDVAMPKVERLLARHPEPSSVTVRATMTHQHHDLAKSAAELSAKGFGKVMMGSNQGFSFFKGPYDLTDEDRRDLYVETEEMLDQGGLDDIRAGRRKPYSPFLESLELLRKDRDRKGPQTKISCGVGRNDQGIDVDGGVYPCHRYVGMSAYKIGDIWNGVDRASVAAYYERVFAVYKHCSGCWATRWCGGGCPQYLSDPTGKVYGPDAPMCDSIRRALERNLGLLEIVPDNRPASIRACAGDDFGQGEPDGTAIPGT